MDKITNIDDKIEKLKKKKIRMQTQKAILFLKEAERIFKDAFSPDIALAMLSEWNTASETKKKEWTTRSHSFRSNPPKQALQKTETLDSASLQS